VLEAGAAHRRPIAEGANTTHATVAAIAYRCSAEDEHDLTAIRSVASDDREHCGRLADWRAPVAHRLAEMDDWGMLYDRSVLATNTVPVAAAVFSNDMYVEREYSLEAAAALGGVQVWETGAYAHDGPRCGSDVLSHLVSMSDRAGR
jgi:hypothetical protein